MTRRPERPVYVDATMAVIHLRRSHGIRVSPATIRQWAKRDHITRRGFGRLRYELHEIVEYALKRAEGGEL